MNDVDVFLEHHGILGMHWGIINKKDPPKKFDESEHMKAKYGPDSMKADKEEDKKKQVPIENRPGLHDLHKLSPTQKKLLLGAGGLVAAGVLIYALKKHGESGTPTSPVDSFKTDYEELVRESTRTPKALGPGLAAHWDKGISLPKDSIIQRLSTEKETTIRPEGFFAAYKPEDIQRYEAKLPNFWKTWKANGVIKGNIDNGYLTQLKANTDIKAPSGKETVGILGDLIRKHINSDDVGEISKEEFKALSQAQRNTIVSGMAKRSFATFSLQWAKGYDNHPDIQEFFKMVKSKGYNALIDFNDAGNLADSPLRLLNGSDFKIVGNKLVSKEELANAAKTVKELVMFIFNDIKALVHKQKGGIRVINDNAVNAFLEHHGVKGQHWGIRNIIERHELNKASRAKAKALKAKKFEQLRKQLRPTKNSYNPNQSKGARAADIERARKRISSGAYAADRKEAKAQYKIDKQKLGRAHARFILKQKRAALYKDVERSQQYKDGAEAATAVLTSVGNSLIKTATSPSY